MKRLFALFLFVSPACAGVHIMQGDAAGGALSGTYPNPTLASGATTYINNTNDLQSGSTFYVSSGTVNGQLIVNSKPATGFGSEQTTFRLLPSNSSFNPNGLLLQFTNLSNTGTRPITFQSIGNDGSVFANWVIGNTSHQGSVLETVDQGSTYMLQGAGASAHGETIVLSSASGISNFPDKATLDVYSYSGFNKPIFEAYSSDGSGGSTVRFRVDHSTVQSFVPFFVGAKAAASYSLAVSSSASGLFSITISTWGTVSYPSNSGLSLTSCGANPTVTGSNVGGTITMGSGISVSSCTLTFSPPFKNTPLSCVVSDDNSAISGSVTSLSNTAVTFTLAASLAGGHIYYHCDGND